MRDTESQFWVNGARRSQSGSCDQTLLEYLREVGLTGTKEGCASGDCGACTVLIQADSEGAYKAANACILPVRQLENQGVLTVEGLSELGKLHPVQQAMIDHHGSQCGFCTPGFVMAMAGWLSTDAPLLDDDPAQAGVGGTQVVEVGQESREAISGNLCRCTGYRSILSAMTECMTRPKIELRLPSTVPKNEGHGSKVAKSAAGPQMNQRFFQPSTMSELETILDQFPEATLIAGGTDLMLEVTQKQVQFPRLISLIDVAELQRLELKGDTAVIGAGVTLSHLKQVADDAWPQLGQFLSRLGSPQIRNRGTLGGNLGTASPIGDLLPILLAMDAKVRIGQSSGVERVVTLEDYLVDYRQTLLRRGEFIIEVELEGLNDFHRYYKITKRQEDDISAVGVSLRLKLAGYKVIEPRIAVGGVAAKAIRLRHLEAMLEGALLTRQLIAEVQESAKISVEPISDVRASAAYRRDMTANLITRGLEAALGLEQPNVYQVQMHA